MRDGRADEDVRPLAVKHPRSRPTRTKGGIASMKLDFNRPQSGAASGPLPTPVKRVATLLSLLSILIVTFPGAPTEAATADPKVITRYMNGPIELQTSPGTGLGWADLNGRNWFLSAKVNLVNLANT